MIDIERLISEATKNQDIPRRDTYRLIKNEILTFRTQKKQKVYDEAAEIQLLKDMVSAREKAIEMYKEGKRYDLVQKEEDEIKYIKEFLPKEVSAEEIEDALQKWMSDNGCQGSIPGTRMGEVMKWFKTSMPGAKGQMTSSAVKKYLV